MQVALYRICILNTVEVDRFHSPTLRRWNMLKRTHVHNLKMNFTETLKPLWQLTYWIGLLPDWCSSPTRHLCSRIVNRIGVVVAMVTLVTVTVYEMFQLIVKLKTSKSIHSVIYDLVWLFPFLDGTVVLVYFHIQRKRMLTLFKLCDELERDAIIQRHWNASNKSTILVRSWIVGMVCTLTTTSFNLMEPESSNLLTYYPELVQTFTEPVLLMFQFISLIYMNVAVALAAVVPVFVYFRAGCCLNALQAATGDIFTQIECSRTRIKWEDLKITHRIRQIWKIYEEIHRLVNRSNDLLGFLVISVHGLLFVLICCITDAVLLGLNHLSSSDYIILPTLLLLFISLLTSLTLIASQLERSSRQFASHLALKTSQHSSLTDTQTINLLLIQMQSTVLSARPLDLYNINHSLLLQMSSVVVTYTIILLQSA